MYNNVHSYSQLILLPWGWSSTRPDDYDWMYGIASKGEISFTWFHVQCSIFSIAGAQALFDANGQTYEVGCIPCMLYVASGSSLDWTKGVNDIKFSIGMELRDTGRYGFILPPEQIVPTGEEVWAFHITVVRELLAAEA